MAQNTLRNGHHFVMVCNGFVVETITISVMVSIVFFSAGDPIAVVLKLKSRINKFHCYLKFGVS